jgi:ankyrin repeat protein
LTAGDPGEEGRRRVNVALGRLCYRGEVEAVSMLLAAGASPQDDVSIVLSDHRIVFDLSLKGGAPLHSAGGRGHVAVVSLLLSAGASVAAQDRDVSSLSFFSLPPSHPPQRRWTPLHYACDSGHLEVVKILLEAGAPLEIEDGVSQSHLIH